MIVIHDELDLAPAKVRVKVGGGNAGHNGLRWITAHIGNFLSAPSGLAVGHPGDKALVYDFVLSDFSGMGQRRIWRSPMPRRSWPGRQLPEQDASRHRGGGLRRKARALTPSRRRRAACA